MVYRPVPHLPDHGKGDGSEYHHKTDPTNAIDCGLM